MRPPHWSPRLVDRDTLILFAAIIGANLIAWGWALVLFADRPAVLASAALAWVFGLRHAVDADHIAAIDNAVRKLMQAGDTPKSAGLYFALGHSTVVVVATIVVSLTAVSLVGEHGSLRSVGALIGTAISALFLLLIALVNLVTFVSLWRAFRAVQRGGDGLRDGAGGNIDAILDGKGVLARFLRPMFRIVTRSWHMYPLGLLFGLGFDTATEIGLIGLSAAEAMRGVSLWSVLVFPMLFAAGMALVDTADSVLMVNAYRWAFVDPLRKLWYNLTITGASVLVALFIGSVEALGLLGEKLELSGLLWSAVAGLNDSLANFGFVVVALFALVWLVSLGLYRAFVVEPAPAAIDGFACADEGDVV
ncbi:MAG: HoxN/HupN/NixA family nickel/cobalt transporter [Alphaproteobacteria bacterium]|nr:HoxN/HupN/NixA family nickel/cobalt transporter [Alphaproteobacteria bacterium]